MFKKLVTSLLAVLLISGGSVMAASKKDSKGWDKVFPKSEKVDVKKVSFKNRFGIELVGDLYTPKTYKKGDKVTAAAPESPVKTDNGTWTFVGWDKDGAQTKTETVEDHDVVFTGYWKYSATKFHVTYVAKVYGTGADLPKEVAKELEGRCPVDDKEYNDGDTVWIKEPTSKADYADSTGRVWNYRMCRESVSERRNAMVPSSVS